MKQNIFFSILVNEFVECTVRYAVQHVNDARSHTFTETYQVKELTEPFAKVFKHINVANLLPSKME